MIFQSDDLQSGLLNVAAFHVGTYVLGPGRRAGLWVQGCDHRCPGCIAPEWHSNEPVVLVSPDALVARILADHEVTGLTISGGEPFLQASGLAAVARTVRQKRGLDVVCYTGFTLSELVELPDQRSITALLASIDVLIDGRYVEALNDGHGLRGSTNQEIHHLTGRLQDCDLVDFTRSVDIVVQDESILVAGLPPAGFVLPVDLPQLDERHVE